MTALITEIQRCSLHDGPGIRTTVFLKGCILNCKWCHNPECISFKPQAMQYPEKCIHCGKCDEGCFSGAKVICGKTMTAKQVINEILLDKPYYGNEGGVTFSGGEPLCHADFLRECLKQCRKNNINVCIETSLSLPFSEISDILSECGLVFADFKIFNKQLHKEFVGIDNKIIKENILRLDELRVPFVIRTPVIPGINDTAEEIGAIADFIKECKNLKYYELLAYHPLGLQKAKALGVKQDKFETPAETQMRKLAEIAAKRNIRIVYNGKTYEGSNIDADI